MGGIEYSFLSSLGAAASDSNYSDALRLGFFTDRGIPFGVSLDFGFLSHEKQRYTRIGFFNFGKQPKISSDSHVDGYYRVELLSFNWKEGGNFDYSPGLELGMTVALSSKYGIALFSRGILEARSDGNEKRWGQEDGPQGFLWIGLSFVQMNHYKPAVAVE